jgi:hypothetical protein
MPICYKIGLMLLGLIVILVYLYLSLILLELALFNIIMLGIMLVYLSKLYFFIFSVAKDLDHKYRNMPLKKYIEQENLRLYSIRGLVLIVGKEGKWIEIQLPDSLEDQIEKERLNDYIGGQITNSPPVFGNYAIPEEAYEEEKGYVDSD